MTRRVGKEYGFTLLETAIAVSIFAVILTIIGSVLVASTGSADYIVGDSISRRDMQRALDTIQDDLRRSGPSVVSVNSVPDEHDVLTLQTAGPWTGEVEWGATDTAGVWRESWSTRYRVVNSSLVRETLDGEGALQGVPTTLTRDIDEAEGTSKGFEVTQNGSVHVLQLRVRRTFSDGVEYENALSTSVHVKNSALP
jgi:prepilin-type N-terminal cleavage/methylation domain-containing protein